MGSAKTAITWKWAGTSIVAASYLPVMVAFAVGVGHCEACQRAWLTVVWFVQGCVISILMEKFVPLPRVDEAWGIVLAAGIQLIWLAGWTWLAIRNKAWLFCSSLFVLGFSMWTAWAMNALIRM